MAEIVLVLVSVLGFAFVLWMVQETAKVKQWESQRRMEKASEWTSDSRKAMEKDLLWLSHHPLEKASELESE
jgi:hypothetical protein